MCCQCPDRWPLLCHLKQIQNTNNKYKTSVFSYTNKKIKCGPSKNKNCFPCHHYPHGSIARLHKQNIMIEYGSRVRMLLDPQSSVDSRSAPVCSPIDPWMLRCISWFGAMTGIGLWICFNRLIYHENGDRPCATTILRSFKLNCSREDNENHLGKYR